MSFRTSIIAFAALITCSCAYGYAGKEGKRVEEPQTKTSVKVVTVEETESTVVEETPAVEEPPGPQSPCGVRTFQVEYYDPSKRQVKTIDCVTRSVVDSREEPVLEARFAEWKSAGLPDSQWYVLVDPKGARPSYLDNSTLLKLSRQFSIDYYGRDASRDLLVYLYQEEVR